MAAGLGDLSVTVHNLGQHSHAPDPLNSYTLERSAVGGHVLLFAAIINFGEWISM